MLIHKGSVIYCVLLWCCSLRGIASDDSVNEYFDLIFANLRAMIIEKDVEPIYLPSDSDTFSATLFNKTLEGSLWVGDGEVEGFSTIHRTGNMTLGRNGLELIVGGHVGLTGITAKYFSEYHLGPFSSNFGVSVKISFASLNITTDYFISPSELVLAECAFDELSTLQVHLKGLGLFDTRAYNLLVSAVTQILQPVLTSKIEGIVCNLLEQVINGGYTNSSSTVAPAEFMNM